MSTPTNRADKNKHSINLRPKQTKPQDIALFCMPPDPKEVEATVSRHRKSSKSSNHREASQDSNHKEALPKNVDATTSQTVASVPTLIP